MLTQAFACSLQDSRGGDWRTVQRAAALRAEIYISKAEETTANILFSVLRV